jgi:G patch domain-containing protein 1
MDEEDDQLFGKKLVAKQEFDTFGTTIRVAAKEKADSALSFLLQREARDAPVIPGPIIDELIVPSSVPIGKRLLTRMGWREGQGVGPLAPRKSSGQRPRPGATAGTAGGGGVGGGGGPAVAAASRSVGQLSDQPVMGKFARPPASSAAAAASVQRVNADDDNDEGDDNDPFAAVHVFAPSNAQVFRVQPKNDRFGLGFDPLANAPEFRHRRNLLTSASGSALGTGATAGALFVPCVCDPV